VNFVGQYFLNGVPRSLKPDACAYKDAAYLRVASMQRDRIDNKTMRQRIKSMQAGA
jgi:hypothetical protein